MLWWFRVPEQLKSGREKYEEAGGGAEPICHLLVDGKIYADPCRAPESHHDWMPMLSQNGEPTDALRSLAGGVRGQRLQGNPSTDLNTSPSCC